MFCVSREWELIFDLFVCPACVCVCVHVCVCVCVRACVYVVKWHKWTTASCRQTMKHRTVLSSLDQKFCQKDWARVRKAPKSANTKSKYVQASLFWARNIRSSCQHIAQEASQFWARNIRSSSQHIAQKASQFWARNIRSLQTCLLFAILA